MLARHHSELTFHQVIRHYSSQGIPEISGELGGDQFEECRKWCGIVTSTRAKKSVHSFSHASREASLTWKSFAFWQMTLVILNHGGTSCDPNGGWGQFRMECLKYVGSLCPHPLYSSGLTPFIIFNKLPCLKLPE